MDVCRIQMDVPKEEQGVGTEERAASLCGREALDGHPEGLDGRMLD